MKAFGLVFFLIFGGSMILVQAHATEGPLWGWTIGVFAFAIFVAAFVDMVRAINRYSGSS